MPILRPRVLLALGLLTTAASASAAEGEPATPPPGKTQPKPETAKNLPTARLLGWGQADYGQLEIPADLREVADVASGWYHAVALTKDGKVRTWGGKAFPPSYPNPLDPSILKVPEDLPPAVAVAAGGEYSAALLADGTVRVWGKGAARDVPANLAGVRVLKGGGTFLAALQADGRLSVWGQVHASDPDPFTLNDIAEFDTGNGNLIALTKSGKVVCRGATAGPKVKVPSFGEKVVSVFCSSHASFAQLESGKIVGWGDTTLGQLVAPARKLIAMEGGDTFCLGIGAQGQLIHWGSYEKRTTPPEGLKGAVKVAAFNDAVFALVPTPAPGQTFEQVWARWNKRPAATP